MACAACSGSPDATITISSVPDGPNSVSGSLTVRPCIGTNCVSKVDTSARFHVRVINNSGVAILVQFRANISVASPCQVEGIFNCGFSSATLYSTGTQDWFYVCVPVGGTYDACMDHFLTGDLDPCCSRTATIDNITYTAYAAALGDGCFTTVPGECCGGTGGTTGFDPGCPTPTTGHASGVPCPGGVSDCSSLIGACFVDSCPACPTFASANYLTTAVHCVLGSCTQDGTFNCCVTGP